MSNQVVRGKLVGYDDLNPTGLHQGLKPAGLWPARAKPAGFNVMLGYPGISDITCTKQVMSEMIGRCPGPGQSRPRAPGPIQPKDPDLTLFKRRLRRPLLRDGPDIP